MLKGEGLAALLEKEFADTGGGVSVLPKPDITSIKDSGAASIDLRLGRWFATVRQTRMTELCITDDEDPKSNQESRQVRKYFIRFGKDFVLHPGRFVLGATLEWIRLPSNIAGYITGKSSWGRRGLVVETAAGIHPGFSGCLTLELVNVGEVPIKIKPGMQICQIFLHQTEDSSSKHVSSLAGRRRPSLGVIKSDEFLKKISAD